MFETACPGGILGPSSVAFSEFSHGPPRQLERLFAPFARDLPGRPVSGDVGHREGLFQPDQSQDRPSHQICQGRCRHRRGSGRRRHHEGLQDRHRHLHRGVEGRTRRHRAGIDPHHRDRRIRAEDRYRQSLSDPPLLSRAGRQGRPRRVRGDPRNHQEHEQGRDRPRGADQPRAHHRAGAAGQGPDGHAAALPL